MSGGQATALTVLLVVLAAALLAGAYLGAAWAGRGPEDDLKSALVRLLVNLYARLYHRVRYSPGPPATPIPAAGPAIVVANHQSGVDPLTLVACTRRLIHFMMAREYFELPGLRWLFRLSGAIPVNRDGNDLGATKAAIKVLRDGKLLGIFPEGGIRSGEDEQLGGKSGVALLALKTGAPVVPAHISGTPRQDSVLRAILTPSRSSVRFGEPIVFTAPEGRKPTREEIDSVTRQILDRVVALRAEEKAGAGT